MARTLDEVRGEAMQLSIEERSALADELWQSTLSDEERAIQEEWIDVAERRLDELRSGAVTGVPWEEARERLFAKFDAERSSGRRG